MKMQMSDDSTIGLSKDPKYKRTVADTIRMLREIHGHVEREEKSDAIVKIEFAIESFQGEEDI